MAIMQTLLIAISIYTFGSMFYFYHSNNPVSTDRVGGTEYIKLYTDRRDKHTTSIPLASPRVSIKPRERMAVMSYLSGGKSQVYHFLVMLYGSWKFIIDHQNEFYPNKTFDKINDIDLLAFCNPAICKEIHSVCTPIEDLNNIEPVNLVSRCYAIEQPFEVDIPYGPLNSFIMFNRTDITSLIPKYNYVLRTDNDVFITPTIYKLKPRWFLHGHGGYSDPFNIKRLKEVANRLNMTHRGRHAIGSTWCGDTEFFIKAGKKTIEATKHLYLNEFDPNATGLETIDFKKNREGEWIRWWRPVSSMYGGELALNHLITDFSDKNKGEFDSSSCDKISIWKTSHIHCWHDDCEFQKFKFMKYLNVALNSNENLPGSIVHRIMENTYPHNVTDMSLREYSTYIAWSSVSKYLRKWFAK